MSFFKWFRRNREDEFSEYHSSRMTPTSNFKEDEQQSDFGYCFEQALSNDSLIFTIIDCDDENCGHIICTSQGKITVLFDERWTYDSSDEKYLAGQVRKFYTALST